MEDPIDLNKLRIERSKIQSIILLGIDTVQANHLQLKSIV